MGTEPVEEEIPVELSEFPNVVQTAIGLYYLLQDQWDGMGGNYLGKDLANLFDFFRLYQVEETEQLFTVSLIQQMDSIRGKIISEKLKQEREASSRKKA